MFMVIVNQIEESQEELKSNRRIPGNQKSNKNCLQKKREKENLIKKKFMSLLCHRFDNKGRRRKCGNLQRKKKKKNLNPERECWI